MTILFLHGWQSVPGGVKPTYLKDHGHTVINPKLPDEDFDQAVRIAQAEFDKHQPQVVVGSSRGGAVAMNIESDDARLVLLCPAWKKWGTVKTVRPSTVVLHSNADEVIPFADSEELAKNSGVALVEIGGDHRMADPESLGAMLRACENLPPIFGGIDISSETSKCAIAIGEASYAVANAPTLRVTLNESTDEGQDDWCLPTVAGLIAQLSARCKSERRKAIVAMDIPFGYPLKFGSYLASHPLQSKCHTIEMSLVDDLMLRACEKQLKRSLLAPENWNGTASRHSLWQYFQSLRRAFFSETDPKRKTKRNKNGSVKASACFTTSPLCTVGDKIGRAIARWIRLACDLGACPIGPSLWKVAENVYLFECYPLASLVSSGLWHPDLKSKDRGPITRAAVVDLLQSQTIRFASSGDQSGDRNCGDSWGKVETGHERGSDVTRSDHTFDALICTCTAWWCGSSVLTGYGVSGFEGYPKPPRAQVSEKCFTGTDGTTLDEFEGGIYYPKTPEILLDP